MMSKTILEHMLNFQILIHKKIWACALCLEEGMCAMNFISTNGFVPKKNTKMFYHAWLAKFSWFLFLFSFWLQVLNFSLKSNLIITPPIFVTTWIHVIKHFIQYTFDKFWPIFPHREFPSSQFSSTKVKMWIIFQIKRSKIHTTVTQKGQMKVQIQWIFKKNI
jgi:hypothetical protein